MIFLCSLVVSQTSFFSPLRNISISVDTSKQEGRKLLEREPSWYYIYSYDEIKKQKINIEFKTEYIINKHWMSIFLTGSQAYELENSGYSLRPLKKSEKYIKSDMSLESAEIIFIETSDEFVEPKIEELEFFKMTPHSYYVHFKDLNWIEKAIEMLCSIPEVSVVMISELPKSNNYMGAGYTQLNTYKADKVRYLNEMGLKGTGTIVGVTDTFIDTNSTFFYDDNYKRKLDHGIQYKDHRKMVIIVDSPASRKENTVYTIGEHGTHTSGSAVGSALDSSVSAFNGVAPDAKLAFVQSKDIIIEDSAFKQIIDVGAKIISNSWGIRVSSPSYITKTTHYNLLMKNFPDNLFVFCAHNDGTNLNPEKFGYQTVSCPGSCKNALTVGALDTVHIHPETPEKKVFLYLIDFTFYEFVLPNWVKESDVYKDLFTKGMAQLILTDLNPSEILPEYINQCLFYVKTEEELKALSSDPPQYIVTKFSIQDLDFSIFKGKKFFIGSVDEFTAEIVERNIAENKIFGALYPNYKMGAKLEVASFSSKGPHADGLLKPDVVAPGEGILSAASFPGATLNHNYTTLMSGTSMSTPNVAGACALVQQYFQDRRVNTTGALIRAVIINSADPLDGVTKYPNVESGFGQVNLGRYIPTDDKKNAKLIWRDNETISSDSHIVAEIYINITSEPMRITLSYLDEVASTESAISIVVDLDLVVESPSHKIYRGNHRLDDTEEKFSTNERVIINTDELEKGTYKVHVFSNDFKSVGVSDPFKFSIVGFGSFDSVTFNFNAASKCITCPQCASNLVCESNKKWKCYGSIGNSCQSNVEKYFHELNSLTLIIGPIGIVYVDLYLPSSDFDDVTYMISPNDPFGATYTFLDSYNNVSQIDGISSYGPILHKMLDNHDHKYPKPNEVTKYCTVMIKSNSPVLTSVKVTSLVNQSLYITPTPKPTSIPDPTPKPTSIPDPNATPVTMWTKDFKIAFGLAIAFAAAFFITLFVAICCCCCC